MKKISMKNTKQEIFAAYKELQAKQNQQVTSNDTGIIRRIKPNNDKYQGSLIHILPYRDTKILLLYSKMKDNNYALSTVRIEDKQSLTKQLNTVWDKLPEKEFKSVDSSMFSLKGSMTLQWKPTKGSQRRSNSRTS